MLYSSILAGLYLALAPQLKPSSQEASAAQAQSEIVNEYNNGKSTFVSFQRDIQLIYDKRDSEFFLEESSAQRRLPEIAELALRQFWDMQCDKPVSNQAITVQVRSISGHKPGSSRIEVRLKLSGKIPECKSTRLEIHLMLIQLEERAIDWISSRENLWSIENDELIIEILSIVATSAPDGMYKIGFAIKRRGDKSTPDLAELQLNVDLLNHYGAKSLPDREHRAFYCHAFPAISIDKLLQDSKRGKYTGKISIPRVSGKAPSPATQYRLRLRLREDGNPRFLSSRPFYLP